MHRQAFTIVCFSADAEPPLLPPSVVFNKTNRNHCIINPAGDWNTTYFDNIKESWYIPMKDGEKVYLDSEDFAGAQQCLEQHHRDQAQRAATSREASAELLLQPVPVTHSLPPPSPEPVQTQEPAPVSPVLFLVSELHTPVSHPASPIPIDLGPNPPQSNLLTPNPVMSNISEHGAKLDDYHGNRTTSSTWLAHFRNYFCLNKARYITGKE